MIFPRSRWLTRLTVSSALCVLAVFGCKKDAPPPEPEILAYAKPEYTLPESDVDQPPLRFTDVTGESGVAFVHYTGAFGKKWMPETIGSGGGFLDYNNDDLPDIFLVNGSDWPGREQTSPQPTMKLFRNRGDGTFEDVTEAVGLNITCYGMGCTFADYDGDGDVDIYVTAVGDNLLLRNDGARFVDVTESAGVSGQDPTPGSPPSWSMSATWVDVDRDGRLDLFVANYVKWTPETDIFTTLDGTNKSYATPQQYDGQSCRLYRNVDGVRFEDVTAKSGVFNDAAKSLGVVMDDFNNDGWPDLFVTNDTQPNCLYMNKGDGSFEDTAMIAGCGYDEIGRARAGMGVDVIDVNNDGVLNIVIGNFTDEPVSLYAQIGEGLFQDAAGTARLSRPTLQPLTFGVLFVDLDLDGFSDLVTANGHIEPAIATVRKEITFAQRPALFRNNQKGQFIDISDEAGAPFAEPIVARGIATADYDNDGDPDLLITVNGGPAKLLRNDTPVASANWIKLRLRGAAPNTTAIGAVLTATAGDLIQRRIIRAGSSYLTQSDTTVLLGLGPHKRLDNLTIRWPNGRTQQVGPLDAGRPHEIRQSLPSIQDRVGKPS